LRLVDANLLVYSYAEMMPQHERAKAWLEEVLNGVARVGLPWSSLLAFVRLVANPRVFERPASIPDAWHEVERWLSCPAVWNPEPTTRHGEVLGRLLTSTSLSANQVPDAHLAAIAIEHGLIVCTTDTDFHRFPEIRVENPLKDDGR